MNIVSYKGQIEVLSGLHIGGGDDTMKIGGIDNSVIKNVNTDEPYIPGSSLKGKMRSLLEWDLKLVGNGDGGPFSSKFLDNILNSDDKEMAKNLLKLFGDPEPESPYGITRISVGDCPLNEKSKVIKYSEAKFENSIDRKKGTAKNPRQTERVPAGVKFDFDIRVKILEEDDEGALLALLERGMQLVEQDYLGGSGSRGYGRIAFVDVQKEA
ncbi:type III-A CRISPR-associated RAMP protein Csm3 [Hydrogenimonas cancrithermarum]|uniref:CRISPR system Cms endoribonuclease Csm3 n=1 Tax=Hydrogenimonas cancrithermarum TaxID=2993563 RepID=A0ABM8FI70_9BACT|nr:type III-A CRISPR-associated RAMP protein Csm3 [Hydrogenimonas cancrithermarum]BDY11959.1 type III-A CRISPR-associated RAMP protein Csm3 [Hydrogenimonas cancrithermarum]